MSDCERSSQTSRPGRTNGRGHGEALSGRPWAGRRKALRSLFEGISSRYDRLNRLLSFGLDQGWRRWAARSLSDCPDGPILDLASGTGDLAVAVAEACEQTLLRADLSAPLLRLGGDKLERFPRPTPAVVCEMDQLPFRGASVAGISQGFALRHCRGFEELFAELFRVLIPDGRIALLDMRWPPRRISTVPYRFYFRRLRPGLAALFGGDRSAYEMMVESVVSLPAEEDLLRLAEGAGFIEVRSEAGIFGAVRLITARKPRGGEARPTS